MKTGQYCQRQRCKHVKLEQFLACFRVTRVCQRQLGFLVWFVLNLVLLNVMYNSSKNTTFLVSSMLLPHKPKQTYKFKTKNQALTAT